MFSSFGGAMFVLPNSEKMKTSIIIVLALLFAGHYLPAQERVSGQQGDISAVLNIFLDCAACDMEYFRTNFSDVNYVHERQDADVHILVSAMPTGSGGTGYTIRLIGQGRYEEVAYKVTCDVPEHYSYDETRSALLNKIRLALVPYLLETPAGERLSLSLDKSPIMTDVQDNWKNWYFTVSGSGSYSSSKFNENLSIGGSFNASKITEDIKFETGNGFGYSQSIIKYYDSDTLASYTIKQQNIYSQNLFVKSLGNHWGVGGFASLYRDIQENYDFQAQIGPAVEYNLFSYKEAADRQCRILYSMTYEYADYHDTTMYNSLKENLLSHNLGLSFSYLEPWGTLSASAGGTAYLDDMTQYSVGLAASADVNISGGFSIILSGNAGYSQNQRYLRGGEGNLEDILTEQWQQETGFYYGFNIGIAYSFGSKYNNAVNPRFGF
jgi:hypothetical protein